MGQANVPENDPPRKEAEAAPSAASHARVILALIVIVGFLDVIDFSIVFVALPTIQAGLGVSLAESQWIIGAYGLTMAGFLMLSGRAGDVYGQKRLFLAGIGVFTIASLAAGFAPSLLVLVVSRGIQGIGAAITSATALAILAATFPEGRARNRAFGVFVATLSAGFAAGSIAGGVLTATFGWRSVMFVNVPIGAVAALLSLRFLAPDAGGAADRHLDVPGAVTVTSGLLLLVYALTNAAEDGFASLETTVPLVLSALILAAFVAIERRSKAPLMPLAFLRRGSILTANALGLVFAASAGALLFILTIFLQEILGYSALSTALGFLPATLVFFLVGGWGSSWLVNRFGMKPVLVSAAALTTVGVTMLTRISPGAGYLGILPGFLIWSLGASIGFPALTIAALAGTRPGEEGLASGLINTSQRLGGPVGLAIFLTIIGSAGTQTVEAAAVLTSPASVVVGFQQAFFAMAILNALGFVIALSVRRETRASRNPSA